jgi:hypothetical protein
MKSDNSIAIALANPCLGLAREIAMGFADFK